MDSNDSFSFENLHSLVKVACIANVSGRFRNKERGTRVKDGTKNGASKRACPHFHFLALVSFLVRSKLRIPFLGLSLLQNQTETLATQAIIKVAWVCLLQELCLNNEFDFLSSKALNKPEWKRIIKNLTKFHRNSFSNKNDRLVVVR